MKNRIHWSYHNHMIAESFSNKESLGISYHIIHWKTCSYRLLSLLISGIRVVNYMEHILNQKTFIWKAFMTIFGESGLSSPEQR